MFSPKIRLPKELFERCKRHVEETGYSSVEEFVIHVLEKETRKTSREARQDEDGIATRRLRGLGYLE